jgi:hypothetical protein
MSGTNPLNREVFRQVLQLYSSQPWLIPREEELLDLIELGEVSSHQSLIFSLLKKFHCVNEGQLSELLSSIAEFIVDSSGFEEATTQIAALTYDNSADSSQSVLQWLKLHIYRMGWHDAEMVNNFGRSLTMASRGREQIVYVDEFIGSGKTVISRMEYFAKNAAVRADVKFCFVAGMEKAIEKIENLGFEVFCPLILSRGISDANEEGFDRYEAAERMTELEEKLAPQINSHELSDVSFGFGRAEALYTMEMSSMNTPNSVFPIFWWPRLIDGTSRRTVLTRVDRGLK